MNRSCQELGVRVAQATHWRDGGKGAIKLAQEVLGALEVGSSAPFKLLYEDDLPIKGKIFRIATEIYRASSVVYSKQAEQQLSQLVALGCDKLPVCVSKTQYSFSANPSLLGAPRNFELNVRELRWSAGAGFVVAMTGDIIAAPGLPRVPAAETIDLNSNGEVVGLF